MTRNTNAAAEAEAKRAALEAAGTLNKTPHAVSDPLFQAGGFFDPRDLLQLRYEMVRRHRIENVPMALTAELFGVSPPTAYHANASFEAAGLVGLLPQRRGPKQGHKLTPDILAHIEQCRRDRPAQGVGDLLAELEQTFGLTLHRRSLERVLESKKKRPRR